MAQTYGCLESGVKESDIAGTRIVSSKMSKTSVEKITVRDKLKEIGARCVRGKLIDGKGRQVRFYFLQGCWGNPPADYLEIMERQRKEIESLKRTYTVIEMTCNPSGLPIP